MLAGMPTLEELYSEGISLLTGNIKSLRVLKDRLEKVDFSFCFYVEGNFMDLAGFLLLMELNFDTIAVRVDIRDIRDIDFPKLEQLTLPKTVYCGWRYELQRISDGPNLIRALYLLSKQCPETHSPILFLLQQICDHGERVKKTSIFLLGRSTYIEVCTLELSTLLFLLCKEF